MVLRQLFLSWHQLCFVFQQVGLLFMRSAQLFTIEMLYFAVGYLKEFSFFDLQYMVLPY